MSQEGFVEISGTEDSYQANRELLKRAYKDHYMKMVQFTNSFIDELAESQDIVQNSFIRLMKQIQHMKTIHDVLGYLYTSNKNAAFDYLRSKAVRQKHSDYVLHKVPEISFDTEIERKVIQTEFLHHLYELVQQLPDRQKEVMQMLLAGKEVMEIADELKLVRQSVLNTKSLAIKSLRSKLGPNEAILMLVLSYSSLLD